MVFFRTGVRRSFFPSQETSTYGGLYGDRSGTQDGSWNIWHTFCSFVAQGTGEAARGFNISSFKYSVPMTLNETSRLLLNKSVALSILRCALDAAFDGQLLKEIRTRISLSVLNASNMNRSQGNHYYLLKTFYYEGQMYVLAMLRWLLNVMFIPGQTLSKTNESFKIKLSFLFNGAKVV